MIRTTQQLNYPQPNNPINKSHQETLQASVNEEFKKTICYSSYQIATENSPTTEITQATKEKLIDRIQFAPRNIAFDALKTLNGETTSIDYKIDSISDKLHFNLSLAQETINHTQDVIRFSSNHPRNPHFTYNTADSFEAKDAILCITRENRVLGIDSWVKLSEKYNVGNCEEMILVGHKYAQKKTPTPSIEIFKIEGGDHGFLVFDRNPNSSPSDYKNWGPNAVICDPWSGAYYPASQLEKHLKDFITKFFVNGKIVPVIQPFNPNFHSLSQYQFISTDPQPKVSEPTPNEEKSSLESEHIDFIASRADFWKRPRVTGLADRPIQFDPTEQDESIFFFEP